MSLKGDMLTEPRRGLRTHWGTSEQDASRSNTGLASPSSGTTALSGHRAQRPAAPVTDATYLQMKPPLSHFRLASVFSGKSSSGLCRTSTSTDSSAWTRGRSRSSSADTMS